MTSFAHQFGPRIQGGPPNTRPPQRMAHKNLSKARGSGGGLRQLVSGLRSSKFWLQHSTRKIRHLVPAAQTRCVVFPSKRHLTPWPFESRPHATFQRCSEGLDQGQVSFGPRTSVLDPDCPLSSFCFAQSVDFYQKQFAQTNIREFCCQPTRSGETNLPFAELSRLFCSCITE